MREAPWRLMEHNVQLVFLFTVVYWSANSIISQHILSGYVYVLTASKAPVGLVKGIQGLVQLLCALPAGYAADHTRRDRILILAGVVGVAASVLTALAFELGDVLIIYLAFGIWGAFTAFQSSAMEALFADSVPMGQRSAPFTLKYVMRNVALVLGPVTAILLLWKYGDAWTLAALSPVLIFGTSLTALSMVLLFQFDDDLAFENRQAPVRPVSACCGMLDAGHVPYLLFLSDFIVSNGMGLVTAFFPLFFLQEYNLSPVRVQTLFALQSLGVALLSFLAQMASSSTGRMPIVVITRVLGTLSLLLMAVSHDVTDQSVLFLAHGAFMQCTDPLRRSVLMDFVPKSHRARWASLAGLTAASWAGSAVLGGIIVDSYGYRLCFLVAALVYICGLALETILIPLTRHATESVEYLKLYTRPSFP
ncbi:hypothetical protein BBO99_00000861 [Phytophthora kernoviae]|uniref:Major facilitator superfamily (MFS) profile domain-containing protein n=1 Tax=Phytophthora kernoviae TaxID=325452 RepID=A0A3R7JBV8_9STRA|nr:hypothetical protein BBI17_000959 [Phytophthora kernoviae]RLN85015.1 hypothetical protein BBO99_00000861 [Phytophthora kernoviae]